MTSITPRNVFQTPTDETWKPILVHKRDYFYAVSFTWINTAIVYATFNRMTELLDTSGQTDNRFYDLIISH